MLMLSTATKKTEHAPASLGKVQRAMAVEAGRAYGNFDGTRLDSAFQPVYSLPHRRIIGHEGLLRASNTEGKNVPPKEILKKDRGRNSDTKTVFLDRLCRTIHLHNYRAEHTGNLWLFLNVSAQVINLRRDHGPFFADLLACYDISPQRVVVEIVEGVIPDSGLLTEAVKFYRDAGCVVAIDDFGAEASDIERMWHVCPDIVKLDSKIIAAAEFNHRARRILGATVALIHEAGSLALLEGVENRNQAMIALDSHADMVQGFYFAKPTLTPLTHGDGGIGELADSQPHASRYDQLQPYLLEFKSAVLRMTNSQPMESACAPLLGMEKSDRCYVASADGWQIGTSLVAVGCKANGNASRFAPLEDATGANWARKPYHYRAISHPGELQISRPYLSVANSGFCITLSASFQAEGQTRVLCCDLEWQDDDMGNP